MTLDDSDREVTMSLQRGASSLVWSVTTKGLSVWLSSQVECESGSPVTMLRS